MNKVLLLLFVCLPTIASMLSFKVFAESGCLVQNGGNGCGFNFNRKPWLFNVDSSPSSFVEPPAGMADSNADSFNLKDLIGTSINGILEEDCGGYCITGFCAHLKVGFSLTKGLYYYTIISPRLEHALPDLLVTSYNNNGDEPLKEWQKTFGKVIGTANTGIASIIKYPDGLQGGRADPLEQGDHQTVSFKEVDIVGHPLAALPALINEGSKPAFRDYKIPNFGAVRDFTASPQTTTVKQARNEAGLGIDPSKIKAPTLANAKTEVKAKVKTAIQSLDVAKKLEEIKEAAQTIKNIKETINIALTSTEAVVRGSVYGNFLRPRFRAPRLFCPTDVKAFQPYYLSFADSFWWRSGYPLTDGPISGTDHSGTVINPLSMDTLQKVASVSDLATKEIWGNLYPRDGSINQSHDAKTGSVLAWRGMDVLHTAVKSGHRVGVPLPTRNATSRANDRWQLIYPEVKNCRADPYYPQGADLAIDSLLPSKKGAYAWNYYRTYDCCSNTSGSKIADQKLVKICLPLSDVLAGIDEDRDAYEAWLLAQQNQGGGGNR